MGIPGLGAAIDAGSGGLSANPVSGTGPVSVSTGGIHFGASSAASSVVDPQTLLIIGGIVLGAVWLRRK